MRFGAHITGAARRFAQDDTGAALVEFAIVLPLFLLLFFGLIDFGRMGADYTLANKAMQRAVRLAVVRQPICDIVGPTRGYYTNERSSATISPPPRFGTSCYQTSGPAICRAPSPAACTFSTASTFVDPLKSPNSGRDMAQEIWNEVQPLLPANATIENLRYTYTYDSALNFLGGPYVPVVTVEITNLQFTFVSPLGALAALAGAATGSSMSGTVTMPAMRMTLPGEDLALGTNG